MIKYDKTEETNPSYRQTLNNSTEDLSLVGCPRDGKRERERERETSEPVTSRIVAAKRNNNNNNNNNNMRIILLHKLPLSSPPPLSSHISVVCPCSGFRGRQTDESGQALRRREYEMPKRILDESYSSRFEKYIPRRTRADRIYDIR